MFSNPDLTDQIIDLILGWFHHDFRVDQTSWPAPKLDYCPTIPGSKDGTLLMAPPPDLTQALLNLLNNAADACPENLQVTLDWTAEDLTISIRDHGAGVPLAIAEQIGKPFFTTKGKGFGLGLFLSKASVTRAGGSVKLYSHEEGGTLTELRLPHGARGEQHE